MAEKLPSPEQINEARQKEADAKQALDDFNERTGGVNLNTFQQTKQDELEKEFKSAKKEREVLEKPIKEIEKNLAKVNKSIDQARNAARNPQSRAKANIAISQLTREKEALEKSLTELTSYVQPEPRVLGAKPKVSVSPELLDKSPIKPSKPISEMNQQELDEYKNLLRGYTGPGKTIIRQVLTAIERTVTPTTATTTTTGGGAGGTGVTGGVTGTEKTKKKKKTSIDKIEARFRQMFPQQAWLFDIDQAKYPGLRKALIKGYNNEAWKSQEGIERFIAELNNTDFFVDIRNKNLKQKITGIVGDLGFDENSLGRLYTEATNFDWDDDTLALNVYKEAFRRNADGTYVHDQAEKRARQSNAYLRIQGIGTQFFNQLTDATVESVLTGAMIEEDVFRQQRVLAKSKYGHLSELIDQGLTMEDITASYRDEAARLLERDPNAVNMADAMYQTAYDFTDESGQKRLMTTGEWVRKLRTDGQYGWDKTENAKREARQLSSSIVQAFGRVM